VNLQAHILVKCTPGLDSVSPASGPAGTTVTLMGHGFSGFRSVLLQDSAQTGNLGNVTLDASSPDTKLTGTVPAGITPGVKMVTVQTGAGASQARTFTVTAGANAPTITMLTPSQGPVGTRVLISGTKLTGATAVAFNGVAATFTVSSATLIVVPAVPSGATTGPVTVTTPGGTGISPNVYFVPPTFRGVDPGVIAAGMTTSPGAAINTSGVIVGTSTDASSIPHAVTWKVGTAPGPTPLPLFADTASSIARNAFGINDTGVVVGSYVIPSGATHAFRWGGSGPPTDLGTLTGMFDSEAQAVSSNGVVVGRSRDGSNNDRAVIFTGGTPMDLGSIGGGVTGAANAVSPNGQLVVGTFYDSTGTPRAFVWSGAGGMRDLGTPPGPSSATGVNDAGQITGSYVSGGVTVGFLYTPATGFKSLTGMTYPQAINRSGDVVGDAMYRGGYVFPISAPGFTIAQLLSINDSGVILARGNPSTGTGSGTVVLIPQ
jgi:probable HAF family extracellular repeat protein